jgi:hypothetical protein
MADTVSHGRGGAGNINPDDTKYVDGEVTRVGEAGSHGDGAFSTGRGGTPLLLLSHPNPPFIPYPYPKKKKKKHKHNNTHHHHHHSTFTAQKPKTSIPHRGVIPSPWALSPLTSLHTAHCTPRPGNKRRLDKGNQLHPFPNHKLPLIRIAALHLTTESAHALTFPFQLIRRRQHRRPRQEVGHPSRQGRGPRSGGAPQLREHGLPHRPRRRGQRAHCGREEGESGRWAHLAGG